MRSLLGELWVRAAAVPEGTAVALGQAWGDAAQISLVPSGGQELGREGTHVRRVSPSPRPPSSAPFSRAGARGSWGGRGSDRASRPGSRGEMPGGPEVVRGPGRRQQAACPVPGVLGAFSLPSHSCRRPDELPGLGLCVRVCIWQWALCAFSLPLRVCLLRPRDVCVRELVGLGLGSVSPPRLWLCPPAPGAPGSANGAPGVEQGGL